MQATVTTLQDYPDPVGSASSKHEGLADRIRGAILLGLPDAVTRRLIEFRLFCQGLSSMASSGWRGLAQAEGASSRRHLCTRLRVRLDALAGGPDPQSVR